MPIPSDRHAVATYIDEQRHQYVQSNGLFHFPNMEMLKKRFRKTHESNDLLMLAYLSSVIPVTKTLDSAKKFVVSCWDEFLDPKHDFFAEILHRYAPALRELGINVDARVKWLFEHPRLRTLLLQWTDRVANYPNNHSFYDATRIGIANILIAQYIRDCSQAGHVVSTALKAGSKTTRLVLERCDHIYYEMMLSFREYADDAGMKSILTHPLFQQHADVELLLMQGMDAAYYSDSSLYDFYCAYRDGAYKDINIDDMYGIYRSRFDVLDELRVMWDPNKSLHELLSSSTYIGLWSYVGISLYIVGHMLEQQKSESQEAQDLDDYDVPTTFAFEHIECALDALKILSPDFYACHAKHLEQQHQEDPYSRTMDESVIFTLLDAMYGDFYRQEFFHESMIKDEASLIAFFNQLFMAKHPEYAVVPLDIPSDDGCTTP